MSDFSSRLKEERKRIGVSQAELGTAGGVSKDAQLNYESGDRSPNASYLQAIADAGVDVLYVLTGRRSSLEGMPDELRTLVRAYDLADKDGKAALQMVSLLAVRSAPMGARPSGGNTVTIGGDVGQQVNGDQTVTAPMTFTVGGKRK